MLNCLIVCLSFRSLVRSLNRSIARVGVCLCVWLLGDCVCLSARVCACVIACWVGCLRVCFCVRVLLCVCLFVWVLGCLCDCLSCLYVSVCECVWLCLFPCLVDRSFVWLLAGSYDCLFV